MTRESNRQWILKARPTGWPTTEDFELVERAMPSPNEGQVLLRSLYLSVDPYMRMRLRDAKSYAPPVGIGEVMVGGAVARVEHSRHPDLREGDIVETAQFGWRDYAALDGDGLRRVDPAAAPISTALGVLGMPGLTAYFGVNDILEARSGETVLVSGGAGAVGSIAGQIARIRGCRTVGVAGSAAKIDWLRDALGFDAAFNYKEVSSYPEVLRETCPDGVDGYFDNVGGPLTDAVFAHLTIGGRIALSGQISQYNLSKPEMGPRVLWHLIAKQATVKGFLVFGFQDRYAEGLSKLTAWVNEGSIKYRETVMEGLEKTPEALVSMMRGDNIGKMVVRVSES